MSIENSIARAKRILESYRKSRTDCEPDDPIGGVLRDLLTDLAHFCDAEGIDIDERMGAAMEVFEEEQEDAEEDGTSGQDRESYTDDQDRSSYT